MKTAKEINYSVRAFIYFQDGVLNQRPGKVKVKALNENHAKNVYISKMMEIWDKPIGCVQKIEFIEVKKG